MKPNDDHLPNIDEHAFDRLVDGELSEPERRELLAGLDDVPGGWRRCAIGFLETQCWNRELGSLTRQQPTKMQPAAKSKATGRSRRSTGRGSMLLAMAASFFLALGLSSLWQQSQLRNGPISPGGGQVADVLPGASKSRQGSRQPRDPRQSGGPSRQWRIVRLGGGPEGTGGAVLPAAEYKSYNEARLRELPPAFPPELLRALRRSGHEVRQTRQLIPFQLDDGRLLLVPVDQFEIHYANNPKYQ